MRDRSMPGVPDGVARPDGRRSGRSSEWKSAFAHLHRHPLDLRELLQRVAPALAAETTVLGASEGHMRLVGNGSVIDVNHPGFESHGEIERFLHVVGDDGRGETVLGIVGNAEWGRSFPHDRYAC